MEGELREDERGVSAAPDQVLGLTSANQVVARDSDAAGLDEMDKGLPDSGVPESARAPLAHLNLLNVHTA